MFRKEVQEQFKKEGWSSGRNVQSIYNKIKDFEKLPQFLKDFLYEYGDLEVETHKYNKDDVTGIMDFKAITKGIYNIENCLKRPIKFGEITTFPIAYYDFSLLCDADGRIYMVGDYECLVSNDFKTGIEKVIMEDYSDTLEWNPETQKWVEEY